jgi:hypothetical protein
MWGKFIKEDVFFDFSCMEESISYDSICIANTHTTINQASEMDEPSF